MSLYEIKLPLGKTYKILCVPDIHLSDQEFKNTNGYVDEQEGVVQRIIKGAEEEKYNMVILLGDVCDREYKDVAKAMYHMSLFKTLKKRLNGLLFEVISNHYWNKKKSYIPTYHLLGQVKSGRVDKSQMAVHVSSQYITQNNLDYESVIVAPDRIHVNGNVINFFHYSRDNKNYYDNLEGVTYNKHIGIYHDAIMPPYVQKVISEMSNGGRFQLPTAYNTENTGIFDNVDYAVVGDIHTKVGEFRIKDAMTKKETVVDIPGSLGRTAYHRAQMHNEVHIPLLTIHPDGTVEKSHVHFPLKPMDEIYNVLDKDLDKKEAQQMKEFKSAISNLSLGADIFSAMEKQGIEEKVKDIITSMMEDTEPIMTYEQYGFEKKVLSTRINMDA